MDPSWAVLALLNLQKAGCLHWCSIGALYGSIGSPQGFYRALNKLYKVSIRDPWGLYGIKIKQYGGTSRPGIGLLRLIDGLGWLNNIKTGYQYYFQLIHSISN